MPPPAAGTLDARILALLPSDGTPVLNRVMRAMLGRAWERPIAAEARLDGIGSHCESHGIGLIRLRDPQRPETAEILVDPKRRPTLPAVIDGFLESRLSPTHRTELEAAVREARA